MKTYGAGCKKSNIDGTEKVFSSNISVPSRFSLTSIMPPILDQGDSSKCVAYSLTACMDFIKNIKENDNNGKQFSIDELYNMRKNKNEDGMDIKDGLSILLHKGLKSADKTIRKIHGYAKVNSHIHLQCALMLNGPCPAAFPVRSYDKCFWRGSNILGYHCVVITGYDEHGFEIRNSWGKNWSKNGYTHISYDEFDENILEIWTLFK